MSEHIETHPNQVDSTHSQVDEGFGHGNVRGGFHPHILPLKIYLLVGGALFFLTFVTVAVAQVDMGATINLIVAILVATAKASLVALFFMHLLYDNKLYLLFFLGSLLFLAIFIIGTLADTLRRGDVFEWQEPQISPISAPAGPTEITGSPLESDVAAPLPDDPAVTPQELGIIPEKPIEGKETEAEAPASGREATSEVGDDDGERADEPAITPGVRSDGD